MERTGELLLRVKAPIIFQDFYRNSVGLKEIFFILSYIFLNIGRDTSRHNQEIILKPAEKSGNIQNPGFPVQTDFLRIMDKLYRFFVQLFIQCFRVERDRRKGRTSQRSAIQRKMDPGIPHRPKDFMLNMAEAVFSSGYLPRELPDKAEIDNPDTSYGVMLAYNP